jgi:mRNA interferase RelE/StbE
MPQFAVTFARSARKELQSLPTDIASRILDKIDLLLSDPRPSGSRKLSGPGSLWRLRIGDYRVIYEIDEKNHTIDVSVVRHRREAYR